MVVGASKQPEGQATGEDVDIRERRKENIFVQKIRSITDIFEETLVSNQDLTYRQINAGYLFCMRTTVLNRPEAVEIRLKDAILPGIRQAYIISAVFPRCDFDQNIFIWSKKIPKNSIEHNRQRPCLAMVSGLANRAIGKTKLLIVRLSKN